jgi:hypothetical protein
MAPSGGIQLVQMGRNRVASLKPVIASSGGDPRETGRSPCSGFPFVGMLCWVYFQVLSKDWS